MSPARLANRPVVARQIALGYGTVTLVAAVLCALLIVLVNRIGGVVHQMQQDEEAIRSGLTLATAVREQYIHILHAEIEGTADHLDHYQEWRRSVREGVASLARHVPPQESWRLREIGAASDSMDEILHGFLAELEPRAAGPPPRLDHERLESISIEAASHADTIARSVEANMAEAHAVATEATHLSVIGGAFCVALIVALSLSFTLRLRAAVLSPLRKLTDAAEKLGAGDTETRVGCIGRGELQAVANAFDKMAAELADRARQLVERERMAVVGRFAAGVAHELNNPIGIIRGYLKTMDADGDREMLREELGILDEEAASCQRIVEDLLTYARLPDMRRESVAAETLLTESIRRIAELPQVASHSIQLEAEPATLSVDPGRIRQLLANLLTNAAEASAGDSEIAVQGRLGDDGGYVISVADRGSGIDGQDRARIFEPFFSRRPGGHGLGLAVSYNIARAHGGDLVADDRPGGGTVFRLRLPVSTPPVEVHG